MRGTSAMTVYRLERSPYNFYTCFKSNRKAREGYTVQLGNGGSQVAGRSARRRSASLLSSSPIAGARSGGESSAGTSLAARSCCNSMFASSAICRISESTWSCGVDTAVVEPMASSMYDVCTSKSENCDSNLSITNEIYVVCRVLSVWGGKGREGTRTRSRFIVSIALSMPLTTLVMFPVTCRIVVAVSTRLATASMRLARRSRFSDSLFLRIALEAYIRAPSLFPCWSACSIRYVRSCSRSVSLGGREEAGGVVVDRRRQHEPSLVVSSLRSHLFVLSLLGGLVTLL